MSLFQYVELYDSARRLLALTCGAILTCASAAGYAADCSQALPPPSLTQAQVLARVAACNRDVINARREVSGSRADLQTAAEAPNPDLTVGIGTINPGAGIGSGPYWDKTVDSSIRYEQLIERGGKRALRTRSARQLLAASEQDVADALRQSDAAALQAMVDLAEADARVSLLTEVSSLYEETLRANQQRTRAGDLAPIDAERQALDATRADMDLQQAHTDATRARMALAGLLAWESQAGAMHVDPAILNVAPLSRAGFDPLDRADIRAARLRVQAALTQRDLARALARADVTAGLQFDHFPTSVADPVGTGNTVSVSLSMPLMIRHQFEGELARATSDSEAASEALQRIEAGVRADWARLDTDVHAARERLETLQTTQMPRAEKIARAIELGYSKGAMSVLDLLAARRELRQTRLDLLAARADLARATLARNRWIASAQSADSASALR
jgi:cobalt-zinc-cadmium efflux system outer membrane protein